MVLVACEGSGVGLARDLVKVANTLARSLDNKFTNDDAGRDVLVANYSKQHISIT